MREERQKALSHVPFFVTPWAIAYQTPPSMGFSRQGYWSGLPLPSPAMSPYHRGNSLCLSSTLETFSPDSQYILSFIFSLIHESEQTLGDSEGQGSLACCGPWSHKELDTT